MFVNRKHTIVLVTRDLIARVDLLAGKSVEVVTSYQIDRRETAELADAVAQALTLGAAKHSQIWVLSDEVWSGLVTLPDEVILEVGAERIEQSLALEAEFDSGIPAFDCCVGYLPSQSPEPGQSSWWVSQTEASLRDAIDRAIPRLAGQLSGIASLSHTESLSVTNLHDRMVLEQHARDWLTACLSNPVQVPVIRASTQQRIADRQRKIRIGASLVAICLCLALYLVDTQSEANVESQKQHFDVQEARLKKQLANYETRAKNDNQSRVDADRERVENAERIARMRLERTQRDSMRRRPAEIMSALAATAHQEHWIQSVHYDRQQSVLIGMAVSSAAMNRLTRGLQRELFGGRWEVQPATMSADPANGLIRFQVVILHVAESEQAMMTAAIRKGGEHVVRE